MTIKSTTNAAPVSRPKRRSFVVINEQQAFDYMQTAKRNAAHENGLRFLEAREKTIWR
ncbi:hypothetical protein SAMN05216319_2117 [Duganella sp. CF402]|nr:hypothetical protein EV582_1506 [Duganella sp. BK701]SEL56663.1 hypothetical protein SAMN05216319_2117 [Duganella sp. CF402]